MQKIKMAYLQSSGNGRYLPLHHIPAVLRDDPFDALQHRIGTEMCHEYFPHRGNPSLQHVCGLTDQIACELLPHMALHGNCLSASGHDYTGVAFTADIKGEMVFDAHDGTGTRHIIVKVSGGSSHMASQKGEVWRCQPGCPSVVLGQLFGFETIHSELEKLIRRFALLAPLAGSGTASVSSCRRISALPLAGRPGLAVHSNFSETVVR
jgi:hypothetical protein